MLLACFFVEIFNNFYFGGFYTEVSHVNATLESAIIA